MNAQSDPMTTQGYEVNAGMIVSRYGNRVVQCPAQLVAELEREREQGREHADKDTALLLADAEQIKDNALQITAMDQNL